MRVQMTSTIAGRPSYTEGDCVDLDATVAREWIREGLAMPMRTVEAETPEMRRQPTEAAVRRGRGRR